MHTAPYSIYVGKRPLRIAFLIDATSSELDQLTAVLQYSVRRWGGRFNPVIFTDGKTIGERLWTFLREFDPDVVKSLVPLEKELINRIHNFLSPFSLGVPSRLELQNRQLGMDMYTEPLSILPTPENVAQVVGTHMGTCKVIDFQLQGPVDDVTANFVRVNFGTFSDLFDAQAALSRSHRQVFRITDRQSLISALAAMSTFETYVHAIQVCCHPDTLPDVQSHRAGEVFTVVIGDSPQDVAYCWNRSLFVPKWKRKYITQVWLPTELALDTTASHCLKRWLEYAAYQSVQNIAEIRFTSVSLGKKELHEIFKTLVSKSRIVPIQGNTTELPTQIFAPREAFPRLKQNMDLYRGTGDEEQIVIGGPAPATSARPNEYWMADVYIQYRPERFTDFRGWHLWWQFPTRNELASAMFGKTSRVCSNGFPSALMERGETVLTIKLPDDSSVFARLLTGHETDSYYTVSRSDKGRYLSGLLKLFSGLSHANRFLEQRYWRHIFDMLCRRDSLKDAKKRQSIGNKLQKKLEDYDVRLKDRPEAMEELSSYVLDLSREGASAGTELPYQTFVSEGKRETEDYNSFPGRQREFDFQEEHLQYDMSELIASNILLSGIRSRCPACGYANWHHINEAKQTLNCKGCGFSYPIGPQQDWHYRLNSLVQAACDQHGLIPVVLVLGQLMNESRSSFIFTTCLSLFKKDQDEPSGEIDILCIKDGKFIIGEVKKKVARFGKGDFKKMAEIAEAVRPDVLFFSSLDPEPSTSVKSHIEKLKEELAPLGVDVRWYQLSSYIFEPRPFH